MQSAYPWEGEVKGRAVGGRELVRGGSGMVRGRQRDGKGAGAGVVTHSVQAHIIEYNLNERRSKI